MPSLHECIALGQIEAGLPLEERREKDRDEIDRLPFMIRWLSMSRPRSRIPDLVIDGNDDNKDPETDEDEDPVTDAVVRCLEERAAMYSEAEQVQLVTCDLAPAACKAFLKRRKARGKKRKKSNVAEPQEEEIADNMSGSSTEEEETMEVSTRGADPTNESESLLRVLKELVHEKSISDDSLLFQPEGKAVLASLMHHFPSLKHKEVAEIICHSGAPKRLLFVLGANCPSAVSSVLAGSKRDPVVAPLCPYRCRADFGELLLEQDALAAACKVIRVLGSSKEPEAAWKTMSESVQICAIAAFAREASTEQFPSRATMLLRAYCLAVMYWMPNKAFQFEIRSEVARRSPVWDAAVTVTAAWLNKPELCRDITDKPLKKSLESNNIIAIEDALRARLDFKSEILVFRGRLASLAQSIGAGRSPDAMDVGDCDDLSRSVTGQPVSSFMGKSHLASKTSAEASLRNILFSCSQGYGLVRHPDIVSFMRQAVTIHDSKLPLVCTLQLEQSLSKFALDNPQFLLQLLYCFLYLDLSPHSPFRLDPRVLPLRHIKRLSAGLAVGKELCVMVDRFCPEMKVIELCLQSELGVNPGRTKNAKSKLSSAIQNSMSHPIDDPDGEKVELAFAKFAPQVSVNDLVSVCAGALFSEGKTARFVTYSMLYRDPLCLLKCPLSLVWDRGGTRRLVLLLLEILMETNTAIAYQEGKEKSSVDELLAGRNAILLQSLLALLTCEDLKPSSRQCLVMVSFVRKLVSRQSGLTATVLRFGLSEVQRDWIIDWVPEIITDKQSIQRLISDSATLSAAQRLVVADFALHMVISHGFNPSEPISLASIAFSQLLTTFYSVLGPAGVSVDVVFGGGGKIGDSSKIARRTALRVIKVTERVRFYRAQLRSECLAVLRKLLAHCKEDVGMGSLAVTTRQKQVLKELLETTRKTLEALGG